MSDKYIVKSGDTLSKIAKEHHMTVEEIARDNNIGNPDRILPGQKLILHPKAKIKIVDAVAEPIKQLECKVTYNGQTHSCFTDEKGNLPELKTRPNDRVKVEVKRMEGGYKTVAEFLMGKRTKDVVLKSPKIRFDSYTNIDHTRNPKMAPKNDGSLSDNEMQLTKKTTVVYNPQGAPVAKVQGTGKCDRKFTVDDAKKALRVIYDTYGRNMAIIIEKMYRNETGNFKSKQYVRCGGAGMESHGKPPYHGWDPKLFKHLPICTWSAFEGPGDSAHGGNKQVTDRKKVFMVFDTVLDAMIVKANYINKYNGDYARWHSKNKQEHDHYQKVLEHYVAHFVKEFDGGKK